VTSRTDPDSAITPASDPAAPRDTGRSAGYVAAGILLSRIAGLIRDRLIAQYFGTSLYASAFRAAARMPNALQNLLGEGTLSASFIPVHAHLLGRGETRAAGRLAGAVFGLLLALSAALVLVGELLAPVIVQLFLWGASDALKTATVPLVRITLPMTGVFVLSAWALGILNSHRRFFLPYVAPVMWNAAMIATLLVLGERLPQPQLVRALTWAALVGGALQFLVQLPRVLQLERELRVSLDTRGTDVRAVLKNAGPAIAGRGVVQISGYLDIFLAGFLFEGAIAALTYAQTIYMLPVSLFGMSIAVAELPEMARQGMEQGSLLRQRLEAGLRRVTFLVVPSAIAYLVLGDVIAGALYRTGRFEASDNALVHLILAGYTLGLVASTSSRLYSSTLYALHDTRTPARIALVRVLCSALLGGAMMLLLEPWAVTGDPFAIVPAASAPAGRPLGALGLATAAGLAAWVEWALLRRSLRQRLGQEHTLAGYIVRLCLAALAGALLARAADLLAPEGRPIIRAAIVIPVFGLCYLAAARALGIEEGARLLRRLRRSA
jgi:putative peptidoglycan lipid II flippase